MNSNFFVTITAMLLIINPVTGTAQTSPYTPSADLYLGSISNNTSLGESSSVTLGTGILFSPENFSPHLRLSLDFWFWTMDQANTQFGPCFFCSINDEVDVGVLTVSLSLVALYPTGTNLQIYGHIGTGFSIINYELRGTLIGIPGTFEDDRDSEISFQYGFGLVYAPGDIRIGIHARRFQIDSSSILFGFDGIDVGGDYLGVSLGRVF